MIEPRTQFENAISQLKELLDQNSNNEDKFQEWFEKHPIVMKTLNYSQNISHPSLRAHNGKVYIPDFIVQLLNKTWEIFELKLPYEEVLKDKSRRNTFYAKIYEYCQQCFEYSDFFSDSTNRKNFHRDHNLVIPNPPRSKIVIGRDQGLDRFELTKKIDQFSNPIDILTYDDILRQLEFDKLKVLGDYENVPGLAVHFVAKINKSPQTNHLISFGSKADSNNLSIYVNSSNQLCYCLRDKEGKEILQSVDKYLSKFKFGESMYFIFEFGFGNDYTICSAEVNGNYGSVLRTDQMTFDLADLYENIVIGSNQSGLGKSDFELYNFMIWTKTFSLKSRMEIRNDAIGRFIDNTEIPEVRSVFYDNRFVYSNSNINFKSNPKGKKSDLVQVKPRNMPGIVTQKISKGELFLSILYDQFQE